MGKQKSMKLESLDLVLMTALTYLGFHLFFFFWYGAADAYSNPVISVLMGGQEGFANVWTKRILMIGALGIVALSSAFVINNLWDSVKIVAVTWAVLVFCMVLAGGFVGFDAGQNALVAFDAGDFALGVNFQLITNSAVVIMAIGSLALILFQINYAEKGTQQMKAILKGIVSSGFLWLFYTQIFPIVM